MPIYFTRMIDGSFTVGDSETGFTCYAFPSSTFAEQAKNLPDEIARIMMDDENDLAYARKAIAVKGYDRMNWKRIHDNTTDHTTRAIIDTIMEKIPTREEGLTVVPFSQREG